MLPYLVEARVDAPFLVAKSVPLVIKWVRRMPEALPRPPGARVLSLIRADSSTGATFLGSGVLQSALALLFVSAGSSAIVF